MTTKAQLGYSSQLQRGDGVAPPNEGFTTVGEVTSIKGPDQKRDMKDATNMQSPGSAKEFIAGLKDNGTLSFDISWVPGDAQHDGLQADFDNGTLRNFKIVLPVAFGKTISFAALVESLSGVIPVDDKITRTIGLRISGAVTIA